MSILLFFSGMATDWLGIRKSLYFSLGGQLLLRLAMVWVGLTPSLPHRGLLAGPYKTYYPTGQLETEVQADASGRGGYRSYFPSGKLQTESTYAPAPVVQRAVRNPLGDDLAKRVAPTTSGTWLAKEATSESVTVWPLWSISTKRPSVMSQVRMQPR